jgi:asparagine synthase (glutamine-hydrolysing)
MSFSASPVPSSVRRYPLRALEIASGYVFGSDLQTPPIRREARVTPIAAFEEAVREALRRPPCAVAFSGGRDSSAVLAVAVGVARRESLPPPLPVTLRFPESAESEESRWQERVLRHLQLEDWVRLEITDELDCVGPVATAALRRHGLLWPANAHLLIPLLDVVSHGSLLTGDGGDLAFEPASWAVRPLAILGRQVRPTPRDVLRLGFALSPPRVRLAGLRRRQKQPLPCPWLQPEALRAVDEAWRSDVAYEPLRLDTKVDWGWRLRAVQMALETFDQFAADADVQLVHPFNTPRFLASLSQAARAFRFADRTWAMRWLFSGLLPDEVSARPTKAGFRDVFWNRYSSTFAQEWAGEGADPELVNVEVLQALWRSAQAREHFRSCTQLQAAWLARNVEPQSSAGDYVEQPTSRLGH